MGRDLSAHYWLAQAIAHRLLQNKLDFPIAQGGRVRYYSPIATQHTKATEMNATEVKALRASANAAYNAGDMSKLGTVNVWLSSGSYTKPSELQKLDGKELTQLLHFSNADMSDYGWTRVGTAEVIITLDDCKTVTANQVVILQSQLKEMRAEHQQAQNRLTKQIQELLAIDNEAEASNV